MQCAKQPEGSLLCGYYTCDYLRCRGEYSRSWRQLKKSLAWWRMRKVDKKIINQTIVDICKFVTDECCSVDTGSSLMTRASLQRSWSTRAYATGELTSTWMTTSYRVSFDFCELVLFVNYELCECNMNFLTCMHGSWIFIWMDVYMFLPFIRMSTDLIFVCVSNSNFLCVSNSNHK